MDHDRGTVLIEQWRGTITQSATLHDEPQLGRASAVDLEIGQISFMRPFGVVRAVSTVTRIPVTSGTGERRAAARAYSVQMDAPPARRQIMRCDVEEQASLHRGKGDNAVLRSACVKKVGTSPFACDRCNRMTQGHFATAESKSGYSKRRKAGEPGRFEKVVAHAITAATMPIANTARAIANGINVIWISAARPDT